MSTENKENPKQEDNNQKVEEKKEEDEKAKIPKLEEKVNPEEKEQNEKKLQRAQRFGLPEKENENNGISSQEDLNKRKERFKEDLENIEEDEKEKEKARGERGRIIKNNDYKRNSNYRRNDGYRRSNRDFRKGDRYHERRFRGGRNHSYRK